MGSISCCDQRIYSFFRERGKKSIENDNLPINLKRNNKQKPLTTILALTSKDNIISEQNPKSNDVKSPKNKALIDMMDNKLQKMKQKKRHELNEIEKLSGKKLLTEVFS